MRHKSLRRWLIWMMPGCLLWQSCPSGTGPFLAATLQPVLAQVFSELAAALTDQLLAGTETP